MTGLVREFLEYFDLDFTIAVFDPETNFVSHTNVQSFSSFKMYKYQATVPAANDLFAAHRG